MKRYYVGMDVGSTYIKAALLQNDQVMDVQLRPTGIDSEKTVAEPIMRPCGWRWRMSFCVTYTPPDIPNSMAPLGPHWPGVSI